MSRPAASRRANHVHQPRREVFHNHAYESCLPGPHAPKWSVVYTRVLYRTSRMRTALD